MTFGLSLGLGQYVHDCAYNFALRVNHSLMSFCFCFLSFKEGEYSFLNFTEIRHCDTSIDVES